MNNCYSTSKCCVLTCVAKRKSLIFLTCVSGLCLERLIVLWSWLEICSDVSLIGSHFHKTKYDTKLSKLSQVNYSLTSIESITAENNTWSLCLLSVQACIISKVHSPVHWLKHSNILAPFRHLRLKPFAFTHCQSTRLKLHVLCGQLHFGLIQILNFSSS